MKYAYGITLMLAFSSIPLFAMKRELEDKSEPTAKVAKTENTTQAEQQERASKRQALLELLASGTDVNTKDVDGSAPLSIALELEDKEIVKALLDKGATFSFFNIQDIKILRALQTVIGKGNKELVKLIIERASDRAIALQICLEYAVKMGSASMIEYFLDQGAAINPVNEGNAPIWAHRKPLAIALRSNKDRAIIELLLNRGADILPPPFLSPFKTPAFIAGEMKNEELIKVFLQHEPDQARKHRIINHALVGACLGGHYWLAKRLLDEDAEVNACIITGSGYSLTPLTYAIEGGNQALIELLLSNGARIYDVQEGFTICATEIAARKNNRKLVKQLIDSVSSERKQLCKDLALKTALYEYHYDLIKELLEDGASVNAEYGEGNTPLRLAIRSKFDKAKERDENRRKIIELLLASGAQKDDALNRALPGTIEYITDLMGLGILAKDPATCLNRLKPIFPTDTEKAEKNLLFGMLQKDTMMQEYTKDRKISLGKMLTAWVFEKKPWCSEALRQTVLMWAAMFNHNEIVDTLLKLGLSQEVINAQDVYGRTALMYALIYGHHTIAEKLIDSCGNGINLKDKKGNTALFYAAKKGATNCVRKLLRKSARFGGKDQIGIALGKATKNGNDLMMLALLANFSEEFKQKTSGKNPFLM